MDRATAIDKIRKMLATAASVPNSPEGKTAKATAERWMVEHRISAAEIAEAEARARAQAEAGNDPGVEDLLALCLEYTRKHGGSAEALAAALEKETSALIEYEFTRMRGIYTGRTRGSVWADPSDLQRRQGQAAMLAEAHMEVYTATFLWGVEAAWLTRLGGLSRGPEDAIAGAGTPPVPPVSLASILLGFPGPMNENNRRAWQRAHVMNGWSTGMTVLDKLLGKPGAATPTPVPALPHKVKQLAPGIKKLPVR